MGFWAGAGDQFAAGFLYGLMRGYGLRKCATLGCLAGGAVVQVVGAEMTQASWRWLFSRQAAVAAAATAAAAAVACCAAACAVAARSMAHMPVLALPGTVFAESTYFRVSSFSSIACCLIRLHGDLAATVVRDSASAVQRELLDCYALIERLGRGVVCACYSLHGLQPICPHQS
jgi:hypothetical protein